MPAARKGIAFMALFNLLATTYFGVAIAIVNKKVSNKPHYVRHARK